MRSVSDSRQMRAWVVDRPGAIAGRPLTLVERPVPEPGPGQVRVRVSVCGVCRTDLHLAEGDLPPKHPAVTPGHEVVGRVDALGTGTSRFAVGQRIGAAWLAYTDMTCRFCMRGAENLCLNPRFTGWDQDGGYAEYLLVHEHYAYALPDSFADEQAAPLLCAGIIGYRALRPPAPRWTAIPRRWIRRCCSRPSARSFRVRWRRWTVVERWRSPASTSTKYRP